MDLNKKHVVIGIVLLIIAWIGNVFYYKKHVLKEPIFLKHYYDDGRFDLHYIENINSKDKIMTIVLPEIGKEYVDFIEYANNSDHRYYKMKTIDIDTHQFDSKKYRNKVITKAEIQFYSGKVMNVNIGKIYLYSDEKKEYVLKSFSPSASSNNSGSICFEVNTHIKIKDINSKFPDIINNKLNVRINEKDLKDVSFPIELKEGDMLDIRYSFKFNKNDVMGNYVYNFPLYISIEDSIGDKGFLSCYISHWIEFPNGIDINALINNKERE